MSSKKKRPPSLLDPQARGGDTAEGGFAFQENMLVARVPAWLCKEGFSEMVREALGDAEAIFFIPGLGEVRELVEYKDHRVAPAEFWAEIKRFQDIDGGAPSAYQRFVLACPGLSRDVQPVTEALRRVRDPDSFYAGAEEIRASSFDAFVEAIERTGHSREEADFLFSKVDVQSDAPPAEDLVREVFNVSLRRHFPETNRLSGTDMDRAFETLRFLVKSRKNQPIMRAELEQAIWDGIPDGIRADRRPVRVVTATDNVDQCRMPELVFDWQEFFGGRQRSYPPPEAWKRMREELQATRDWIVAAGRPRRVSLGGSRRLSSSLCIGSVFSAVSGFTLDIDYRGDIWRTDEHGGPTYPWEVERLGGGRRGEIAVAIGILRDVREDVTRFLESQGRVATLQLILRGFEPLAGPAAANSAVAFAKDAISSEMSATGARVLHLFVCTPAPFALFLGHRLNALGEVQCYEWVDAGTYTPTCRLTT